MGSSSNPLGSLLVQFAADSSPFDSAIKGMTDGVESAASKIAELGLSMSTALPLAAIGTALAAVGTAAIDTGAKYEEAFNTIIAKTGATGDALNGLKDNFETVFKTVPGDAQAIAGSISLISDRLHLAGQDVTNLATQFAQLSSFSGGNLVSLTDSVTKAFQNWNISTDDQAGALDLLNAVSQKTGIDVTTLAGSMASIGNLARLSGVSFEATAEQVGLLNAKGIDAQDVFQGISKAMATAQKSGVDLGEVTLPNLVYSIEQGIASGNGLNVALTEFGAKAGPKMYELVRDGVVSSASLMATTLDTATDSIKKTYQETDTFGRELTLLGTNIKAGLAPLGEFTLGVGKDFLDWLNKTIAGTGIYTVQALPGVTSVLDKIISAYAVLTPQAKEAAAATDGMSLVIGALGDKLFSVQQPLVDVAAKMAATKEANTEAAAAWKAVQAAAVGFQDASSPLAKSVDDVAAAIQAQNLSAYKKQIDDTAASVTAVRDATGQWGLAAQEGATQFATGLQLDDDIVKASITDVSGYLDQIKALGGGFQVATAFVDNHTAVLQRLGITSTAALQAEADATAENVALLGDLLEAGQATSEEFDAGVAKMVAADAQLNSALNDTHTAVQNQKGPWEDLSTAAKKTFNDLSTGLAQAIVQGDSLSKVFLKVAQDISAAIINVAIKQGVTLLVNSLGGVLSQLGAVGAAIQKVFGSGGSAASIATPPISTTSAIPGIGGSAASAAGSVATGAVSGIMSVLSPISAIANVATAVTGILSMFGVGNSGDQLNRLNIIANNTSDMDWAIHGPGGLWENTWDVRNQLDILTNAFVTWNRQLLTDSLNALQQIAFQTDKAAGAGGTNVTVNIGTVNGTQNTQVLAQQLANTIKRYLPQTAAVRL